MSLCNTDYFEDILTGLIEMKEGPISRESMEIKIIQSFTKVQAKDTYYPSFIGKDRSLTLNSLKSVWRFLGNSPKMFTIRPQGGVFK